MSDEVKRCAEGSAVMREPTAAARFYHALENIIEAYTHFFTSYLLSEFDNLSGFSWSFLPQEDNAGCFLIACRQGSSSI